MDDSWRKDSACIGKPASLFYPTDDVEIDSRLSNKVAKGICATCPVKAQCLRWALDHRENYGIWGGLDPKERRAYAKEMRGEETRRRGPGIPKHNLICTECHRTYLASRIDSLYCSDHCKNRVHRSRRVVKHTLEQWEIAMGLERT